MTTRRQLMLSLAACIAGILIGRALPRDAPPPAPLPRSAASTPSAPPPAPLPRSAALTPPAPPAPLPRSAAPEPTTAGEPSAGIDRLLTQIQADDAWEGPEGVVVRRADGTTRIYRPEDWAPESEQIIARRFPDGSTRWYAGPDAGPRSDPAAFVPLRDLAGPDGVVTLSNGRRIQLHIQDAGPP